MKKKSIAMTIRDAFWEYAKSPGPEGRPIQRMMHLKRIKNSNGKETGSVICTFQYKGKQGTGTKDELFTINSRGRIHFVDQNGR